MTNSNSNNDNYWQKETNICFNLHTTATDNNDNNERCYKYKSETNETT